MKRLLFFILILCYPLTLRAQVPNQTVTLSSNGKYLVNSITGQPVFLTGEDGFLASLMLSNADVTTYLNDRAARGFNAIWLGVTDQLDQNSPPKDFSGNVPFDGAWFTNPDTPYWAHQDFVIQQAAARGITIFLQPSFVGNSDGNVYDTPAYLASSDATVAAYGTFIGNRYKGFNNIVYVVGGDYNSAQTRWPRSSRSRKCDCGGRPKPHHNSRALPGRKLHARKPRYCGLVWRCRLRP